MAAKSLQPPPSDAAAAPVQSPPSAASPPVPSRGGRPLLLFFVLIVAVLLVAGAASFYLASQSLPVPAAATVTITDFGFTWQSPPSSLCQGYTTSFPQVPFSVALGAEFTLTWQFACWNNTGSYVIDNITGVTSGFLLVGSNLPVNVVSTNVAYVNVTLAAPSTPYDGGVTVWITAHAV